MPESVKKLVGRLGGGHAVNLLFNRGHGDVAVHELGVTDDVIALDHAGKVALEEPLYVRRVRARAAQERGGSNVRPPVRIVKFFVSSTMPASSASGLRAK